MIIVTGGAGFIGSNIVKGLNERGRDDILVVDNLTNMAKFKNIQGLKVWDVTGSGSRTNVGVRLNRVFTEADCALCGQCITHCPVGALSVRDDTAKVVEALEDPAITTVVQVAPAVRAAWAEHLGLSREEVEELYDELLSDGEYIGLMQKLNGIIGDVDIDAIFSLPDDQVKGAFEEAYQKIVYEELTEEERQYIEEMSRLIRF